MRLASTVRSFLPWFLYIRPDAAYSCHVSITSPPAERQDSASLRLRVDRIRKRAAERGANSVAEIAALIGVTRQHMYLLFNGTHLPSAPTAQRMADALEMPVEDLWERV